MCSGALSEAFLIFVMKTNLRPKPMRADALDALRGFAIVMMVLCGAIIMGVLPAWMSHCQEPPPYSAFDPSIYGITWVDLVFPFFLFAMGAAFPFSIGSKLEAGVPIRNIITQIVLRSVKLAFFAIFLQNIYPWASQCPDPAVKSIIALIGFLLLFLMFTRFSFIRTRWVALAVNLTGYCAGIALMFWSNSYSGQPFNLYNSNIIILILANMALFGMLLYLATAFNSKVRMAVMALLFCFFLSADTGTGWQADVMNWSPLPWFIRLGYLRYLFIIVPGIYAGEWLREWLRSERPSAGTHARPVAVIFIAVLSVAVIVVNLWGLFTRSLVANLLVSGALVAAIMLLCRLAGHFRPILMRLTAFAGLLLMMGLFVESFQGGIRKDDPTFSYYFVTAGLAAYCLTALLVLCDIYHHRRICAPLTMAGKNPMIAYVAVNLLLMPVFDLLGIGDQYVDFWASTPMLAFARGLILTVLATLVAMFFTRIKWFWRT